MIEYAYSLMARACGIDISDSRLLHENGRSHFMTRRFDRHAGNEKLHMQSLCALAHYDFNVAGAYSYNPAGAWTASHQMTMNGKRDHFTLDDFNACAKTASMKRGRAATIVAEVHATVASWKSFAEEAGVPATVRDAIQQALRLKPYT